MENRNQYNSPRDRIDDALLIRLLNEEEPMPEYTCMGERRNGRSSCQNGMQNRSAGRRSGNSCGCSERRTERENRSGCGETRERQNGCSEMNERQNRSGCGCGEARERQNGCGESRERRECGCESCSRGGSLEGYPLAMVYSPDHDWEDMFEEEEALEHGTLFRRLELPFYPGKCGCGCK